MIAIVQYGLGNVRAIANIYKQLGIAAKLATSAEELSRAERIVLPGVGAFDWAMHRLNESGMRSALDAAAGQRKPILGICVGMQMMADRSDEGSSAGLGWIPGDVKRLEGAADSSLQLPHMGWNDVRPCARSPLCDWIDDATRFYFLHSYYYLPRDPAAALLQTTYGGAFASGVTNGTNIFGVQFHPEKSHHWGIQLLKRFSEV